METGQLFAQMQFKTVNACAGVSSTMQAFETAKNGGSSFEGVMRDVKHSPAAKTSHSGRAETKQNAPDKKDAPVTKYKAMETSEPLKKSVYSAKSDEAHVVKNITAKDEMHLDKTSDDIEAPEAAVNGKSQEVVENGAATELKVKSELSEPQNVEMFVAAAQSGTMQPSPEDRMSKSADLNTDQKINSILIDQQNADKDSTVTVSAARDLPMADSLVTFAAVAEKAATTEQVANQKMTSLSTPEAVSEILTKQAAQFLKLSEKAVSEAALPVAELQQAAVAGGAVPSVAAAPLSAGAESVHAAPRAYVAKPVQEIHPDSVKSDPLQVEVSALPQADKARLQQVPSTFQFAKSALVDVAIMSENMKTEQTMAKGDSLPKMEVELLSSAKNTEALQSVTPGSESGMSGNGSGFGAQQNLDLNGHGLIQLNSKSANAVSNTDSVVVSQVTEQGAVGSEAIASQVKEQLSSRNIKQGSEQLTIRLSPEHLGDIKVSFKLEDQRLKVEIVAENRTARESLIQHSDSLKESLARQNINMEKFEVTGGNSGTTTGQGAYSQPEWREMAKNRQNQQWLASGGYRTSSAEAGKQVPVYFARAEKSTLDLHF
jgi:flagellar hook-length control protein FliK